VPSLHFEGAVYLFSARIALERTSDGYPVQIKCSVEQVLQQVTALLRLTVNGCLIELRQQQFALPAQGGLSLALLSRRSLLGDVFLLRAFARFRFNQNPSDFSGFLHNRAGLIFVLGQMKSVPPGGKID
jgi:hypothetical protein